MNETISRLSESPQLVFQLIALPLVFLFGLRSLYRVLRGRRPRWGAWLGTLVWLAAGMAILQPDLTNRVAAVLGIGRGADLVIYFVAIAFLASCFYFYQKYRKLEADLTRLVRNLAIDEAARRWPPGEAGTRRS